jgi:hypothetical protein
MAIDSIAASTTAGSVAAVNQKIVPEALEPKGKPDHDGDSDDNSGGVQSVSSSVNTQGQTIGTNVSVKA